jgi:hypothetical protein
VRREVGGTATSGDGAFEVVVGPNAFDADSIFVLVSEAASEDSDVLRSYNVHPGVTEDFAGFRDFVEISVAYDDTVSQPQDLCLARLVPETYGVRSVLDSFVDTTGHRVIAYVDSLGPLGLYRSADAASELLRETGVRLEPGYPNPSQDSANILYEIAEAGLVDIKVYSVDGRLVREILSGQSTRGLHRVEWNGTDSRGKKVASGVYYVRIENRGGSASTKLLIVN